jgi:hypothetical protein
MQNLISKSAKVSNSFTVLIGLLSLLSIGTAATEVSSISHAGYFHDLRYTSNIEVSWAGGAIIQFNGEQFADTLASN